MSLFAQSDCGTVFEPGALTSVASIYEGNAPARITEAAPPSGGDPNAGYEFMWLHTPFEPGGVVDIWYAINDATDATYQPPVLHETTWYRRCARQAGCADYVTETVEVRVEVLPCDDELQLAVESADISCAGLADGSILAQPQGNFAPFHLLWADGSTDWNRTDLPPGGYACTLTDAQGCTSQELVRIVAPEPLQLTAYVDTLDCFSTEGNLRVEPTGGSGDYTVRWQNKAGETLGTENYLRALPDTYRVVVTDANGCTAETDLALVRACGEIELTASLENDLVLLEWVPTQESARTFYLLERGPDTLQWQTVSDPISAHGYAGSAYGFQDDTPLRGETWYRVRNVDEQGRARTSNWVLLDAAEQLEPRLFPNPTADRLVVDLLRPQAGTLSYRVFDQSGRKVLETATKAPSRFVQLNTADLREGTYRLVIAETGKRSRVFPFAVMR